MDSRRRDRPCCYPNRRYSTRRHPICPHGSYRRNNLRLLLPIGTVNKEETMQTRNSAESESGRFTTRSMWGVAVLCVLQIWYLVLEFYRHWPAMSITARTLSVLYVMAYPVPWLRLVKRELNPYSVAIIVYCLLGVGALLIFPIFR